METNTNKFGKFCTIKDALFCQEDSGCDNCQIHLEQKAKDDGKWCYVWQEPCEVPFDCDARCGRYGHESS